MTDKPTVEQKQALREIGMEIAAAGSAIKRPLRELQAHFYDKAAQEFGEWFREHQAELQEMYKVFAEGKDQAG